MMSSLPNRPNRKLTEVNQASDSTLGKPFLFTVTEPNSLNPLYDVVLALNQNPGSVEEKYSKSKTTASTYGGFIEWHWPDDLDTISCTASTGAFINKDSGLTHGKRKDSIAYERYLDLFELFKSNGMVYDGYGKPAIRGRVMMIFDRGVYYGHFSSFNVDESAEKPFTFELSWEFKVERSVILFGNGKP